MSPLLQGASQARYDCLMSSKTKVTPAQQAAIAAVLRRAQEMDPAALSDAGAATVALAFYLAASRQGHMLAGIAVERDGALGTVQSAKLTHMAYYDLDKRSWDADGDKAVERHVETFNRASSLWDGLLDERSANAGSTEKLKVELYWCAVSRLNLSSFLKDWGTLKPVDSGAALQLLQDAPPTESHYHRRSLLGPGANHETGRIFFEPPYSLKMYQDLAERFLPTQIMDGFRRYQTDDQTLMQQAIAAGDVDAVKAIVATGVDLNMPDEGYCMALHTAADSGALLICNVLLEAGADPNLFYDDKTPLHYAAQYGMTDVCRSLVRQGADPNIVPADHDEHYVTPFQLIFNEGDADYDVGEAARYFVHGLGADLDQTTVRGKTLDDLVRSRSDDARKFFTELLSEFRRPGITQEVITNALTAQETSSPSQRQTRPVGLAPI
jgi:hypothetical protein